MAIYFHSGFESNTFGDFTSTIASPTIVSTHPYAGSFEMKISSLVSGAEQGVSYQYATANFAGPLYFSGRVYFETLPTSDNVIWKLNDSGGSTRIYITIGAGGGLIRLKDDAGQIGSDIPAISTGAYHFLELFYDTSAGANKHIIWARIDGYTIASSTTRNITNPPRAIDYCGNGFAEAQTVGVWYMDELTINNVTELPIGRNIKVGDGMSRSEVAN